MTEAMKNDIAEARIRLRSIVQCVPEEEREFAYELAIKSYLAGYKHALELANETLEG